MRDKRYLLVDGNHMLHRNLHIDAFEGMQYDGILTGGAYGFLKSLSTAVHRYKPTDAIVVWDAGRSARRQQLHPDYKPRPKEGDEEYVEWRAYRDRFDDSQSILNAMLTALGIRQLKIPGHEADDVIGYITRKWEVVGPKGGLTLEHGTPLPLYCEMIIVSDDMDLAQLVTEYEPTVKHWRPVKDEEISWTNFEECCKVHPDYFVMLKAVKGDDADNIPGVKGVGLKTFQQAVKVLEGKRALIAYEAGLGAGEWESIPVDSTLLNSWRRELEKSKNSRMQKFVNDWDHFLQNIELINIDREIEDFTPDQIKTINKTLRTTIPMNEQRVMFQLNRLGFNSILSKWSHWIQPFRGMTYDY